MSAGLLPEGAGWLSGAAAEAYACDARIAPVVTGRIDPAALAWMVHDYLRADDRRGCQVPGCTSEDCATRRGAMAGESVPSGFPCPHSVPKSPPGSPPLPPLAPGLTGETAGRLGDALTRYAIAVLSGPGGLASALRARAGGLAAAGVSLPLDTGTPTPTVPAHLRRAVIIRDRHCAFPGCSAPPAACQAHHVLPRSKGGVTALHNLALLCS